MGFFKNSFLGLKLYWRACFSILWPIILSPMLIINYSTHIRCLYVVALMAGYWITEAVHMVITSLLPIVLFPIFNLMSTDAVCRSYMKDANMMFVVGLIFAIAIEYSRLHERIALTVISLVGCSPKKLHLGMFVITAFISLWISNTAAAAIMIPIISSILSELEANGIATVWETNEETPIEGEDLRKATNAAVCYHISAAYAATIGGMGTLIGTGTNLAFKGIYETAFPESPGVDFGIFSLVSIPIVVVLSIFTIMALQIRYLGLFRPKSEDAKKISIGEEGEKIARQVIRAKRADMGPMSFHQAGVLFFFVLAIFLWIFREPQTFRGWVSFITDTKVKDSSIGIVIILLMFCVPANPNFIYIFSKDEEKRPKGPSDALLTWKHVNMKLPWGLIFLIGSGFAIADCAKSSGMNDYIVVVLGDLGNLNRYWILAISCIVTGLITQLTTSVAIANIVLPIMAEMSKRFKIHPMFLMHPVTLTCSFAYMLPVSTPPNAICAAPVHMKTFDMVTIGAVILVIAWIVLFSIAPFLGNALWNYETYPAWA